MRPPHIFFIRPSADGRLGCFHALATVNAKWTQRCTSLNEYLHILWVNTQKQDRQTTALFSVFWETSTLFSTAAAPIHVPIQSALFCNPHQHVLLLTFLVTALLMDMPHYPTVVLICISLVISDVEHRFMYDCFYPWITPLKIRVKFNTNMFLFENKLHLREEVGGNIQHFHLVALGQAAERRPRGSLVEIRDTHPPTRGSQIG